MKLAKIFSWRKFPRIQYIGDHILCGIHDAWQYKAIIEESVKNQSKPATATQEGQASPSEPGASQATATQEGPASPSKSGVTCTPRGLAIKKKVIAKLSRSDYTVYVIHDKKMWLFQLLLRQSILETLSLSHVIAQLIGYRIRQNFHQAKLPLYCRNIQWNKFSPMR